jgi:hypothetical protein
MIYATPSSVFAAVLEDAPTGLLPTGITFQVVDLEAQSLVLPASSVGIVEFPSGTYRVERTAPAQGSDYQVIWTIGADTFQEDLIVNATGAPSGPPATNYRPTTAQVAGLIRQRTRDSDGKLRNDFIDGVTDPGSTQAEQAIDHAMRDAYPVFGDAVPDSKGDDPDALRKSAQATVASKAAALIERGYYAEQVATKRSIYPQLIEDWESGLKMVGRAMSSLDNNDVIGASDDLPQAIGEFPTTPYVSGMRW